MHNASKRKAGRQAGVHMTEERVQGKKDVCNKMGAGSGQGSTVILLKDASVRTPSRTFKNLSVGNRIEPWQTTLKSK